MIINPHMVHGVRKYPPVVARWLISEKCMPIGIKDGYFWFSNTDELNEAVRKLPFYLKIFSGKEGHE